MRKSDVCEEFCRLESSEKTIAILRGRWWPQIDGDRRRRNRTGIGQADSFYGVYERSVLSAQMLEVFLSGVATVLRLERGAWSMVK